MRRGGQKNRNYKKALAGFKKPINSFFELLMARIISPRLNIDASDAKQLGSELVEKINNMRDIDQVYNVCDMLASVRFGEQFNFPIDLSKLFVAEESQLTSKDVGLRVKKNINFPYGIIAIMGGPDAGKSALANHIESCAGGFKITAMEPIQDPNEPFLIGPAASALGMISPLYADDNLFIYDSGRFLRGISDYGLGEKGLPIGLSLFLTDLNNLYVSCRKRCFLVISTESNREDYNQSYYHLLRGAVNGVLQPNVGEQSGFVEVKPADRKPQLYTYGNGEKFDALPDLFKIRQERLLEEIEDAN